MNYRTLHGGSCLGLGCQLIELGRGQNLTLPRDCHCVVWVGLLDRGMRIKRQPQRCLAAADVFAVFQGERAAVGLGDLAA